MDDFVMTNAIDAICHHNIGRAHSWTSNQDYKHYTE